MKTILLSTVLCLILLGGVAQAAFAGITKPQEIDPFQELTRGLFSVYQVGVVSLSVIGGDCSNYWATWDHACQGVYHQFTQCVQTYKGGEIVFRTENCADYGAGGWTCVEDEETAKCVYTGEDHCEFDSDCREGEVCEDGRCIKYTHSGGFNWVILFSLILITVLIVGIIVYRVRK